MARRISTERVTLARVENNGPAAHEPHLHEDSDQITNLLEGEMEFTLEGETRLLRPGDLVVIPAGKLHGTSVREGVKAVALEIFTPPRKDL